MPVLARARIEKNTRTTAPREVRKLLETDNGDSIKWVYVDEHMYVRKASLPPTTRDQEKIEKLRNHILEIAKSREYDEVSIALNKHYQQLSPDRTPHSKKVIAGFKGLGAKARALKEWLSG